MNDTSKEISADDSPAETALHYDQFFGPLYFEPYAIEVAKRIKPEGISTALEIAAGTGRVTRHIRERIPRQAKLLASDIDDGMLSVAKKKLSHLCIDWQNIDAQQLLFADNNSIDLVVCCFGYMFVTDKPKAFAEAYRVLKPGGQLIFTTWDKLENNAASWTSRSLARQYLEDPQADPDNPSTSMSDEAVIKPYLQDAGFTKTTIEIVELTLVCPTAKEAAEGFIKGDAVYEEIQKRNPALIDEIKIRLEKEFTERFGAAPMIAAMSALISQAWK